MLLVSYGMLFCKERQLYGYALVSYYLLATKMWMTGARVNLDTPVFTSLAYVRESWHLRDSGVHRPFIVHRPSWGLGPWKYKQYIKSTLTVQVDTIVLE
jgi:hypothetical protein